MLLFQSEKYVCTLMFQIEDTALRVYKNDLDFSFLLQIARHQLPLCLHYNATKLWQLRLFWGAMSRVFYLEREDTYLGLRPPQRLVLIRTFSLARGDRRIRWGWGRTGVRTVWTTSREGERRAWSGDWTSPSSGTGKRRLRSAPKVPVQDQYELFDMWSICVSESGNPEHGLAPN